MNEVFRTLLALPEQASTVAFHIDVLHYVVISVSLLGAAGVAIAVALFMFRFREGRHYRPPGHSRHIPPWVEGVVIAFLLVMFLVFWVVGFRQFVHLQKPPKDAMTVYVVGKKWMWTFAYPDGRASEHDLYVPVGRPVRVVMTSRDVIHSFYVPSFRIKQDVLPGMTTVAWFEAKAPGTYDLYCAEYCGTEHSLMRGRVIALEGDAWARWADRSDREHITLAQTGERVAAEHGCLRCHTVDGTPHLGPTWAGLADSEVQLSTGEVVTADDAYLTESMMDPMRKLVRGYAPIMPSYRGVIQGGDVAAIVEYIRSLPPRAQPGSPPPLPAIPEPQARTP